MAETDPHADLHEQDATGQEDHPPVVIGDDDDWHTAIDKLNKTLTKRINDLCTDTDTFKKTVSTSVQALSNDLGTAKTAIQNNKESIEAQDGLIDEAKKAAAAAKTAADAAKAKADAVETNLSALTSDVRAFETRYAAHTHDVQITMHGETTGPKAGN